MLNARVKDES